MSLMDEAFARGVTGFLHPVELGKLAELATGREVLEIGSFKGLSAWGMAKTAKSVTAVDTHRAWTNGQTQGEEFTTLDDFRRAVSGYSNVTEIIGTSEEAVAAMPKDKRFDMIFLDAMHTYEDCLADIKRWWPRLRRGGVFVAHDHGHGDFPGVKQAADEVLGPPDEEPLVTLAWWTKK